MDIAGLLALLASPARRALESLGIMRLGDIAKHSRAEIEGLHGIGPNAMKRIELAMKEAGLVFKPEKVAKTAKGTGKAEASRAKAGHATVDQYILSYPRATQEALRKMRELIRSAAPEASERISYHMPTFYLNGNLVYFGAFTHHIGLYPLPHVLTSFQEELKGYKVGKGSIQFPLDQELPAELIMRIVRFRVEENLGKPKKPKKK